MKIVHVVYSMEMGGAEVLVAQLCRIQRARGHAVSVFAYATLGSVGETLRAEGFEIYVPGEAHPTVTMRRYFQRFRAMRPDVVHCHNPAPTLHAAFSAKLAGVRCVISTRHSLVAPPYDRAREWKYAVAACFCDWIVGICEATCANLRGAPMAHTNKIVCVYNGATAIVDTPFDSLHKAGVVLLFVGRLAREKDLGTLLHAFALLVQETPPMHLWIVGDGPVRKELESLAEDLGLGERVQFWGLRLDTAQFFSATDLFVMSSISEGLPMSLLQAMSLGVPAVVTRVGGMEEIVQLSRSGLMAPAGDAAALAAAILRMASDPAFSSQCAANARAAYKAHFTLEAMNDGYMALYEAAGR